MRLAATMIRTGRLVAVSGVIAWLWHCWCMFPWLLWNELRLEPSFLLRGGGQIYPELGAGPVTTWIYGPVTPLLFLPATLGTSTASALMIAATINFLIVLIPIVLVCFYWPVAAQFKIGAPERLVVALLCVVWWPFSSFQYIQADNAAVAFGLLANLVLVRSEPASTGWRWLAAAASVAALGCKQTAVGVVVAQVLWVAWRDGFPAAAYHGIRIAACAGALAVVTLGYFGAEGLALNLFELPGHLPWTNEAYVRIRDLIPLLVVHIGAPLIVFGCARRAIFCRTSPWLLPALTWAAALPLGLASLFKIGGTINSMEGLPLLLPTVLLMFLQFEHGRRWVKAGMIVAVLISVILRFGHTPGRIAWLPRTEQLIQGERIATEHPGQIWFPWNPLITYFSERRFDHVEDGLYVRFLAGRSLNVAQARAHLPPRWRGMALLTGSSDWGLAAHLMPPEAEMKRTGFWTLWTWPENK